MSKKQTNQKVLPVSPFSLILVIPGFILYLIFAFLTNSTTDEFSKGVLASIRLLILTMTLFFLVTGSIGYIIYDTDRKRFHVYLQSKLRRNKD